MAIALALVSAIMYGVSDYVGGRASRRLPAVAVALLAEVLLVVVFVVLVPLVEDQSPPAGAIGWGMLGGAASSLGVLGLYLALARGNMTVVAPVTGVIAAAVPVAVGVALGERPGPLAWTGVVIAVIAVALVGGLMGVFGERRTGALDTATVILAIAVGFAFGMLFVAYERAGDSGLWPILFSRVTSLPMLVLAYALMMSGEPTPSVRRLALPGVAIGGLIAGSNVTYLLSTREGDLSVVAVVVSMYPASTVLLASALDGERPTPSQLAGMGLAVVALVLITAGS